MKKIIEAVITFSLYNRGFIFFLTILIAIAGFVSFRQTPIEAYPDVTSTRVRIITQWPGQSAQEVEKFLTIPVETVMNTVPKTREIRSVSLFGLSVVTLIFQDDVDDYFAQQQVAAKISALELPPDADPEIEPPSGATGEIYRYTLHSDHLPIRELQAHNEWLIKRHILSVSGIADVITFGGEEKTFEIQVDPTSLARYGITPLDVYEAVSKSNVNVGGDVIEKHGQAYVVRGVGLLDRFEDIGDIVITQRHGVPVTVAQVANVRESALPRLGQVGLNEYDDLVQGIVVMRRGENPSEVIDRLKVKLDDLNNRILPEDVEIRPFYDRTNLVEITTSTVMKNMLEGIVLVTVVVLIFLADWRTTVLVALIIPLSLLFAFLMLRLNGMSANLISMGAIDFGIIVDGAVIMVEGVFVALDKHAASMGMTRFNQLSKRGIIRKEAVKSGKAIFFSKLIIISALLPIFAFQQVEGKMFSPLAYTLGFALLGALLFSLTFVPALMSIMLRKDVKERHPLPVRWLKSGYSRAFDWCYSRKKSVLMAGFLFVGGSIALFPMLGSEFLPALNEGAIYVRATQPNSTSLTESVAVTHEMRAKLAAFPEVRNVLSQTGRPNDGTDPTGFFNIEFHVDLLPRSSWTSGRNMDTLVEDMQTSLADYEGIEFDFSQPIMDNVAENVSGVKGALVVKVFGHDLEKLEATAEDIYAELRHVHGIEDLGIVRNLGQPELRIELDERLLARYGIQMEDAQRVIEMAIGGKTANWFYENERRFSIRIRFEENYRRTGYEIGQIRIPTLEGGSVPLQQIADISEKAGPAFIYREGGERFVAVKFAVRGRDLGGAVNEARMLVNEKVSVPEAYSVVWAGEFESKERATNRLQQVIPVSLLMIFLLLFAMFGNTRDALLALATTPFAISGGIIALYLTGTPFSISAGVGFIAMFGICVLYGVMLVSGFRSAIQRGQPMNTAIYETVNERVRPVVMTAMMASLGLLPTALSTGIGSESQKPLAIVISGGLVVATILTLFILPLLFERFGLKKA